MIPKQAKQVTGYILEPLLILVERTKVKSLFQTLSVGIKLGFEEEDAAEVDEAFTSSSPIEKRILNFFS